MWKKHILPPNEATYKALLDIVLGQLLGYRSDIAKDICKHFARKYGSEASSITTSTTESEESSLPTSIAYGSDTSRSSVFDATMSPPVTPLTRSISSDTGTNSQQIFQPPRSASSSSSGFISDEDREKYFELTCGCGKCSIVHYISGEDKCPNAKAPNLKEVSLPKNPSKFEEHVTRTLLREGIFRQALQKQTLKIQNSFCILLDMTFDDLEDIDFRKVKAFVRSLLKVGDYHKLYKDSTESSDPKDEGFDDIFALREYLQNNYCSWFNYTMLKVIRRRFLFPSKPGDQEKPDQALDDYEKQFKEYVNRRCFLFTEDLGPQAQDSIKLLCKVDVDFDTITHESIDKLKVLFVEFVKIEQYKLVLRCVTEGCTELEFRLVGTRDFVLVLSPQQRQQLIIHRFISITVENDTLLLRPKTSVYIVDGDCGLTAVVLQGQKLFIYDAGYKNQHQFGSCLVNALREICRNHLVTHIEAIFSHYQPGLKNLIKSGPVPHTEAIVPYNPVTSLPENILCEEHSRLPFDQPFPLVKDSKLLIELELSYHFNRRYPLVKYLTKFPDKVEQRAVASKRGVPKTNDSNVLVQIQTPGFSTLITGNTPIAQFPVPDELDRGKPSVFVAPHQERKDYLSLLPEDLRRPLTTSKSLQDAALYLALYHKRKSFLPVLSIQLKHTSLEQEGKSFRKFLNDSNPEQDLKTMLQEPETKLCQFLYSEHFQLKWYRDHSDKRGPFSSLEPSITKEEGRQYKRVVFLRDSLAWAHFYKHFPAEVYIVSAEDVKQQGAHVINGIAIANFWNRNKCSIVITDSLPLPLDQVLQRDVRKLVFPEGELSPLIHIGFLNRHHASPFFEISIWPQVYQQEFPSHKSVPISIGNEPKMHLIKDEMDIIEEIRTTHSNEILGHIKYHPRKRLSRSLSDDRTHLEHYLSSIGYKHPHPSSIYNLADVLRCLIGPLLVQQLRDAGTRNIAISPGVQLPGGIIPSLLNAKVSGTPRTSFFELTPSKCSASDAKVIIQISRGRPLQVHGRKVSSAYFTVSRARTTESVQITLSLELDSKHLTLDLSRHLNLKKSHGTTVGDHVYSICSREEACLLAKECTAGDIMTIFLSEEKVLKAIQSLPLFLAFPLMKSRIIHYLTSFRIDSSTQALKEAHIYVNSFEMTRASFKLHIASTALHILRAHNDAEQVVTIEGEAYSVFEELKMKFSCSSSSSQESQKQVEFSFIDSLPAAKVFELFHVRVPPEPIGLGLPAPPIGISTTVAYESGFMLSQLLGSTLESNLTSLFFNVEYIDVHSLLPQNLKNSILIKKLQTRVVVHFPSSNSPRLGLEALFISEFELPNRQKVKTECELQVCPSAVDRTHSFRLIIRLNGHQDDRKSLSGKSAIAFVKELDKTLGNEIERSIREIPQIGSQILKVMFLKKAVLHLHNRQIQLVELHITLPELNIIPGKLSVATCMLKISYSKECSLTLDCCGNLSIIKHQTFVKLSLPTLKQKGCIHFAGSKMLLLKCFLEEFGWLSFLQSKPILKEVLDAAVEEVTLDLQCSRNELQITSSEICISNQQLDIGILKLQGARLDVSLSLEEDRYSVSFSLGGFVSNSLYAQLRYCNENKTLSGQVQVVFSKSVSATRILELFQVSTIDHAYSRMRTILKDDFLDVFSSALNITLNPALTASVSVCINVPSKRSKQYSLQYLNLEVKDALRMCCKGTYVLSAFQFVYNQKLDSSSTSHLTLDVRKLNTQEDITLNFMFTSYQRSETSFLTSLTASIANGPHNGLFKLGSAIDLAKTTNPTVPDFARLPDIYNINVLPGSLITFTLKPQFQPSAFDTSICIQEWQVFEDPDLKLHKVLLRANWESGSIPQLTFSNCSLAFLGHTFGLSGRLTAEEVYLDCACTEIPKPEPALLQSILNDFSPQSQPLPEVPTDIGLPSLTVNLEKLIVHLTEACEKLSLNTAFTVSNWETVFGTHTILVEELGGALGWEKQKLESHSFYKAFICGRLHLFGLEVDMEMLLGRNIDSVILASIPYPQDLYYGQVIDSLCSEEMIPSNQYELEMSGLAQLVPSSMSGISFVSASIAYNVNKKQFFLSSQVEDWGPGSVLIGFLHPAEQSETIDYYVVSISLEAGLTFSRFSPTLAFVDELIVLRSVNVLVSSAPFNHLSVIAEKLSSSFSRNQQARKPFYISKELSTSQLATDPRRFGINLGTTLYAEADVGQSSGIKTLRKLGTCESLQTDLLIMAYIGTSDIERDIKIHAWVPSMTLFNEPGLEFFEIHVLCEPKLSAFSLTGEVGLDLDIGSNFIPLKFTGQLVMDPRGAAFNSQLCEDVVDQPYGIRVRLSNLNLSFNMSFLRDIPEFSDRPEKSEISDSPGILVNSDSPKVLDSPEIYVSGELYLDELSLTCGFLLKGTSFKVFEIHLQNELRLSIVLGCYMLEAPVMGNIVIREGKFYYAASDYQTYKKGYHMKADITFLNEFFRVEAHISDDQETCHLEGRALEPIDFGFAKVTGGKDYTHSGEDHTHEGPAIAYTTKPRSLAVDLGVQILGSDLFNGKLEYSWEGKEEMLVGTISCPCKFLWIDNPEIEVRWRKNKFEIVELKLEGGVPGFSLSKALEKVAKVVASMLVGGLSCTFELYVRTEPSNEYLVLIVLYGQILISVLGLLNEHAFKLPEILIPLPKAEDFSVAKLPRCILQGLWDGIDYTIKEFLDVINPSTLLYESINTMLETIKGALKTVINVVKKIEEGMTGFGRVFGFSAFIVDEENGMVLGYIHGGRGGEPLKNEYYTVEQFGPIVTANAVGTMAHEIHKHLKSSITAQEYKKEDTQGSCEADSAKIHEIEEGLEDLRVKADDLCEKLTFKAEDALTVTDVCTRVNGENAEISLEWVTYNADKERPYSKDKGDIEYHVKITAIVIKADRKVNAVSIYDNVFIDDPVRKTGEKQMPATSAAAAASAGEHPSETHMDTSAEGSGSERSQHTAKVVRFTTACDQATLKHTVCLNVSIQPKVTLRVKMLSPDKIEEYSVDMDLLKNEYYKHSEMEKVKKQINKGGRVNEVTLEGRKNCKQHVIKQDSNIKDVEFSYKCKHSKYGVSVTGEITELPGAKCYLVQVVDSCDTTVIPKQQLLFPGTIKQGYLKLKLGFELKPSFSDFPDTSPGPYLVSVLALSANHRACSAFTIKQKPKIRRYNPPDHPLVTLPNLDTPGKPDNVILEWNHPKFVKERRPDREPEVPSEEFIEENAAREETTLPQPATDQVQSEVSGLPTPTEPVKSDKELEVSEPGDTVKSKERSKPSKRQPADSLFYTITISGSYIKKRRKMETVTVEKEEGKVFKDFEVKHTIPADPDSQEKLTLSLKDILKKSHRDIQDGILFRSQIFINGNSKLHSIPKLFPEFILLAPPSNLKVSTATLMHIGAICIEWDYGAHAIGYRVELVDEQADNKVVLTKVFMRGRGSSGTDALFNNMKDFKDLPYADSNSKGLRLQMYSLGFGNLLIRCLKPTIARRRIHVVLVELQYLTDSSIIRVNFSPPNNRTDYMVVLYKSQPEVDTPNLKLMVAKKISRETVVDFDLIEYGHLLKHGDSVVARVCSIPTPRTIHTYLGKSREEIIVLDSPKLATSLLYCEDGTVSGIRIQLTWSAHTSASEYECGFVTSHEYAVHFKRKQTEAVHIDFGRSSLKTLTWGGYCQFRMYIKALGTPGTLALGALSHDTNQLQCINIPLVTNGTVVFTAMLLQSMWTRYAMFTPIRRYKSFGPLYKHLFVYPSGEKFPRLRIPMKIKKQFWRSESSFQTNFLCARDILPKNSKSPWVRIDPFKISNVPRPKHKRPKDKDGKDKPPLKPKLRTGVSFNELQLLFYTRCHRKSARGIKNKFKIDIEIKLETKTKKKKKVPVVTKKTTGAAAASKDTTESSVDKSPAYGSKGTQHGRTGDEKQPTYDTTESKQQTGGTAESSGSEQLSKQMAKDTTGALITLDDSQGSIRHKQMEREGQDKSSDAGLTTQQKDEGTAAVETSLITLDDSHGIGHEQEGEPRTGSEEDKSHSDSPLESDEKPAAKEKGDDKAPESGGVVQYFKGKYEAMKTGATTLASALKTGAAALTEKAAEAFTYVFYDHYDTIYKKSVTVELPHGTHPKAYCRLITYKPEKRILTQQPVFVSVSIKPRPEGKCWVEDTHLFVRFSGYDSTCEKLK